MADPTSWFNWDLPDDGGDRDTWGQILRGLWQKIDDVFAGKELPNGRHVSFASSSDIGLSISAEFQTSNRARLVFGDDGVNVEAGAQFIWDYLGGTGNLLQLQSWSGGSASKTFLEIKEEVFQGFSRFDLVPDTSTALYLCPARASGDIVSVKFGPSKPAQDSDIDTMQRFTIAYDVSDERLYIQTHDNTGAFVANAIIIEANGDVIIGSLNP